MPIIKHRVEAMPAPRTYTDAEVAKITRAYASFARDPLTAAECSQAEAAGSAFRGMLRDLTMAELDRVEGPCSIDTVTVDGL